ncbi:hypothetical protein LIP_3574 [Limnochorda pilosa]|uniref:Uncharacterized protein n=2 Tax=Limnochorda pilosa TaxID=1555112 RepID=A0A0K2SQH9_LIMPI|nr:hypothetical protein LIP_3574 [Limnochorda pilosa]
MTALFGPGPWVRPVTKTDGSSPWRAYCRAHGLDPDTGEPLPQDELQAEPAWGEMEEALDG